MNTSPAIALAVSLALLAGSVNAQQRPPTDLDPVEVHDTRPVIDKGQAARAAGAGCAIGGLLGSLAGVDGTAACAVGGLVGFGFNYRRQIRDARDVEAAARAAGMTATVETGEQVDNRGRKQAALSALTIDYDPVDMEKREAPTRDMLDKLASLTSRAKNNLVVRFEGTQACTIPLEELTQRGALANHTIDNQCGRSTVSRIVVSPMPDVR